MYTALEDAAIDSPEPLNFYGVIIDASYPYKSQTKCICTLKVVDHTLNISDNQCISYYHNYK